VSSARQSTTPTLVETEKLAAEDPTGATNETQDPAAERRCPYRAGTARADDRELTTSEPGQDLVGRQFGFEPPGQRDDSWSPATWPRLSFTVLNCSTSKSATSSELCSSGCRRARSEMVQEPGPIGQVGDRIVICELFECELRLAVIGDVEDGAPEEVGATGDEAEPYVDPTDLAVGACDAMGDRPAPSASATSSRTARRPRRGPRVDVFPVTRRRERGAGIHAEDRVQLVAEYERLGRRSRSNEPRWAERWASVSRRRSSS